jgi:hypothetical protein
MGFPHSPGRLLGVPTTGLSALWGTSRLVLCVQLGQGLDSGIGQPDGCSDSSRSKSATSVGLPPPSTGTGFLAGHAVLAAWIWRLVG